MTVALIATALLLPTTPRPGEPYVDRRPVPGPEHRGLLTIALTALFYNMGFFTLLAFAPFPLAMTASQVGWVFFGWGVLLAFTSVGSAPVLERRIGIAAERVARSRSSRSISR